MMRGMTIKEKADYLWTYYKWIVPVAAFLAIVVAIVVSCIANRQIKILYGGALVNVTASEEGTQYLTEGWKVELGGEKKETVTLLCTVYRDTPAASEANTASITQIVGTVAARELDYVILEDDGLALYENHGIFTSLENMFTQEQLAAFDIVYYDGELGNYPIAIEITDSQFARSCLTGGEKIYIAFPGNTGRTEQNAVFLEYLLNWQP